MNRIKYAWYAIILAGISSSIGAAGAKEPERKRERTERASPYSNETKAKERRVQRIMEDAERRERPTHYRWKKKGDD